MSDFSSPPAGRRILLVEDEWLVADGTARALRALGVVVEGPVGDLDQALRLCADGHFDAVLIDINLNGTLAFALADRLLALGKPFAFVTGYARDNLPARYAEAPLFEKPLDAKAAIRRLLPS